MRDRVAVSGAIIALTFLSFLFPGHTFLRSDTQIYVPMLEHIWDPSALANDLVATKPHLAFTLYDEIAIALRWMTRTSFEAVLVGQQFVFRALEILGVYLLALSFPFSRTKAMLVAALFTLGATILGPAVLTIEYEPVPRAFAVALLFLAIGLVAQNHLMWADIAAAVAFLYHPPTVWVFWILYLWLTLRHRDYRDLWPIIASVALLFVSSRLQAGAADQQVFFARIGPELEQLQRMRASYNWVSTWPAAMVLQYVFLWIASTVAFWRVQPKAARLFLVGMPAIGILSIPLSYLLLEKLKWALIPQLQPARGVLYITAMAVILGAAAGIRAAESRRWTESIVWFAIVLAVPAAPRLFSISVYNAAIVLALAVGFVAILWLAPGRVIVPAALTMMALASFLAMAYLVHVQNYPRLDLTSIDDVVHFARDHTTKDAVFLFGDAGRSPNPSIFRAEALRAVYVDWKSGGQINFSPDVADEWRDRWQGTHQLRFDPSDMSRLAGLGITYLILSRDHALPGRQTVYENSQYLVYRI